MKPFAILLLALLAPTYSLGSQRSLEGLAVPMSPPPMRMEAINFRAKATRGRTASKKAETVGGLKFYSDDDPLFDERVIGVWCDKSGTGELRKDEYQRCIPLLEDFEWDEAFTANRIDLIFENLGLVDGEDSTIILENKEFWFFNKNILQSATTGEDTVTENENGQLTILREGRFSYEIVTLYIPLAEPADEIPIWFNIMASEEGSTLLKLKGLPRDGSDPVSLEYECTNTEVDMDTVDTISDDEWYECQADAAGNNFRAIIFAPLSISAKLKLGHFFYNRINIWYTASELGTGDKPDELGAGQLQSGQHVKMTIHREDCRDLCCFVQEEYSPYPQCKLYCDEDVCLRADKGTAYKTEHSCCEERNCKDRPERCWAAASYWPERTCTEDSTKCYQGEVFESEEDCCESGTGAFPEGCTDIKGEYGPCWKQRSDSTYPHCEKIKNKECEETDGQELENIALGRPVKLHKFYYYYYYYRRFQQLVVDGTARSCLRSSFFGKKWVRIRLRDRKRDIDHIRISTRFLTSNIEVRVGNDPDPADNPVCTSTPTVRTSRSLSRIECSGSGKFLFVIKQGRGFLRPCEVEVYAKHKYNDMVVSEKKQVTQSSYYRRLPPSLSVDGNLAMNSFFRCTMTFYELKPYWGVDLETMRWFTRLKLMRYYYYSRLSNLEIRIGPDADFSKNPVILLVPSIRKRVVELQLPKLVTGRYVSIHARGRARFDFCEVQVFAGPIAWGPSNYFPTEETCCNSNAFTNNECRARPTTPCYKVAGWWPRRTCESVNEEGICLRGWGVWDTHDECCRTGFSAGCSE